MRLVCSASGHVTVFDILGNAAIILSSPAGAYPNTNSSTYVSFKAPCTHGTYRDYTGIKLCIPCPDATYSSSCSLCTLQDSFCPHGAVEETCHLIFESTEQDQDYPESPGTTVFDDKLMQKMFSFNTESMHCLLISPITWTLLVIGLAMIVAIGVIIHEVYEPNSQTMRERAKQIFRKLDLIGEGEVSRFTIDIICLLRQ